MMKIVYLLFTRSLIRFIGIWVRFFFYYLIGQHRSIKSLSNISKNDKNDLENALMQDFMNALIGAIIFSMLAICIAWIIWS